MNILDDALTWLNDPLNWTAPGGLIDRTGEHLAMTGIAVLLAALVALPLGIWLGHTGRGAAATIVAANTTRALPTFGILLILAAGGLFGDRAAIIGAAVFAVPLILSNTYTGVAGVDPAARDAARGMGMAPLRSLWIVELPLAVPLIAAGLRTAIVQVVATIPLAAFVGGGGLGVPLRAGFATQRYGQVLALGLVIALLCLAIDGLLSLVQRAVTPRPLRASARVRG
ncbi:ABC transporter permease [Oerskovia flava]|uniref:ABC transporter permease n=1 Tax=Oerskovia flava TaxID=2986422 RepID=UPI00224091FE|nr:ABC transporter permease subunit [Oerskovia sp. JB1-3-2]